MRWLVGFTDAMDMNLSKCQEMLRDRKTGSTTVHGITKNPAWLGDATTRMRGRDKKEGREKMSEGKETVRDDVAKLMTNDREWKKIY